MNKKGNRFLLAILIDHLKWDVKDQSFTICKGLTLRRIKGSRIIKLYKKMCLEHFLHEGEPRSLYCAIVVEEDHIDESTLYWNSPSSIISQICNLISIFTCQPITSYSILFSMDDFKTKSGLPVEVHHHYELGEILGYTENISNNINDKLKTINRHYCDDFALTMDILQKIKSCYSFLTNTRSHRINNAYNFFFSAWRSHQIEHTCINLSIVLESLFSPSGRDELTHRIAFNACNFLGKRKTERETIFELIKKFYSLRSTIVHGGDPKLEELKVTTGIVYVLCAEILQSLGTNEELALQFFTDEMRNALFKSWMFR